MTKEQTAKLLFHLKAQTREIEERLALQREEAAKPAPVIEPPRMVIKGLCADYHAVTKSKTILLPGCFDKVLKTSMPVLFVHKVHLVAGEVLSFEEREAGLFCEILLHDTPIGRDVNRLVNCGAINALSTCIWYSTGSVNPYNDNVDERTITEVAIFEEVSLAIYPGGQRTMLENATRKEREYKYEQLYNRLLNFFKVDHRIETPEIKEMMLEAYNDVRQAHFSGALFINY